MHAVENKLENHIWNITH